MIYVILSIIIIILGTLLLRKNNLNKTEYEVYQKELNEVIAKLASTRAECTNEVKKATEAEEKYHSIIEKYRQATA